MGGAAFFHHERKPMQFLLFMLFSIPFGIGLYWHAEKLWQAIEKRDREE
jgi:hypothetical protein